MTSPVDFAIIGGTGIYDWPGLYQPEQKILSTPFGEPSAPVTVGRVGDVVVAFLARHGVHHHLPPHRVNYRANIWSLLELGARRIVALNAVGGITAEMKPRALAVPDQIIDYACGRIGSFCDVERPDQVQHVDFSKPYSDELRTALIVAASDASIPIVPRGVHGITQGPRLETIMEIRRMGNDGCDLVGMTGMPEAVLARELDVPYACLAMVANWAAGCCERGFGLDAAAISLEEIHDNLKHAVLDATRIINQVFVSFQGK